MVAPADALASPADGATPDATITGVPQPSLALRADTSASASEALSHLDRPPFVAAPSAMAPLPALGDGVPSPLPTPAPASIAPVPGVEFPPPAAEPMPAEDVASPPPVGFHQAPDTAPAFGFVQPSDDPPPDAAHGAPHATRRRRRSASPLPPVHSPADIPDDAAGRVVFFAVVTPPDTIPTAADAQPAATIPPPAPAAAARPLGPWVPVMALGILLAIVFAVGMVATLR